MSSRSYSASVAKSASCIRTAALLGSIPSTRERACGPPFLHVVHRVQDVDEGPAEPVDPVDQDGVPVPGVGQQL